MKDTTKQRVLFADSNNKPVFVQFDQPNSSSDGGALLLKACDKNLGLVAALGDCIHDARQPGKISHTMTELVGQRIFGIACGYEDCNDVARVGRDPMQKLLLDRDLAADQGLASQPTLSRFENQLDARSLVRMGHALADTVISRHRKRLKNRVRRITIDFDPTDDPAYGGQQMTFFNRHYGHWCYLPVACFLQFNEESDQYLYSYVLRPGNVKASEGAVALLKRTVNKLRQQYSNQVTLRVRLDGGYASAEVFECLEELGVEYVVAIGKNRALQGEIEPLMEKARELAYHSGRSERVYGECQYEAGSWDDERRVICKAEVTLHPGREPRDNPRFVVTNIKSTPAFVYARIYCQRAQIENRIKELLYGLQIDRTSCTQFFANQCRVLLTAAAYVLFQEIRLQASNTEFAHAQVNTIRERLLKVAATVQYSTRRFVLKLPEQAPWASDWCLIARSLGAVPL